MASRLHLLVLAMICAGAQCTRAAPPPAEVFFKDPDFEQPFETIRDRIRNAIVEFIEAVDEQGLLRPGLDRKIAPFVILNAVQWNATQAYFRGEARFVDQAARATAELVARYVFRDARRPGRRAGGRGDDSSAGRVRRSRSR